MKLICSSVWFRQHDLDLFYDFGRNVIMIVNKSKHIYFVDVIYLELCDTMKTIWLSNKCFNMNFCYWQYSISLYFIVLLRIQHIYQSIVLFACIYLPGLYFHSKLRMNYTKFVTSVMFASVMVWCDHKRKKIKFFWPLLFHLRE